MATNEFISNPRQKFADVDELGHDAARDIEILDEEQFQKRIDVEG